MKTMSSTADLKIKIFGDGADKSMMLRLYGNPLIQGFTTNPTLMGKLVSVIMRDSPEIFW